MKAVDLAVVPAEEAVPAVPGEVQVATAGVLEAAFAAVAAREAVLTEAGSVPAGVRPVVCRSPCKLLNLVHGRNPGISRRSAACISEAGANRTSNCIVLTESPSPPNDPRQVK